MTGAALDMTGAALELLIEVTQSHIYTPTHTHTHTKQMKSVANKTDYAILKQCSNPQTLTLSFSIFVLIRKRNLNLLAFES